MARMRLRQLGRILLGLALDGGAWLALRGVPFLRDNPGSASALALCWVNAFILPSLSLSVARRAAGPRLWLAAALGLPAASLAVIVGGIAGLQSGSAAFLIEIALFGRYDPDRPYRPPPSAIVQAVQDGVADILLWSGVAIGSAVAAVTAVGLAACLPHVARPRLSWRVAFAGAWASVVVLPDWWLPAVAAPWREPMLLLAAGLPSAWLLSDASRLRTGAAG